MEAWIIWLIIILILVFIEVSTVNLVSIWFIASAFVSLIVSCFYDNYFVQFAIFVVLGVILLVTTRKLLNRLLKSNNEKINLDRIIGGNAIVTSKIGNNDIGEVKVDGKYWSAISNKPVDTGEKVVVEKIDGVKLIVRKKES